MFRIDFDLSAMWNAGRGAVSADHCSKAELAGHDRAWHSGPPSSTTMAPMAGASSTPTSMLPRHAVGTRVCVSMDGFGADEGQNLERPFGHANPADLAGWADATASWPNRSEPGGSRGLDDYFTRDFARNIGAEIMGRNKLGPQRGPWENLDWQGVTTVREFVDEGLIDTLSAASLRPRTTSRADPVSARR